MEGSHWIRHEVSGASGWATVIIIILAMIFVTNILTIVTFKRMRELQLQHYLIICLAVVDLVTVLPLLVWAVDYLQGYLVLNSNLF